MVDDTQRHKIDRDNNEAAHIVILEFWQDGETSIQRAAINNEDIIHLGETFHAANIELTLPGAEGDELGASLQASNIDRMLGRALDSAKRRINVRMKLIDSELPDVTIIDTYNLMVSETATLSADSIEMQLVSRANMLEPVPFKRTTRTQFPGVWKP